MRLAFPGLMAALKPVSGKTATIVTPTPLQASVAAEQFARSQLSQSRTAWERSNIFSMDAWMTICWQQARFSIANAGSLLSLSQERELWRQIIEQDRPDLFDFQAMASLAQRASRTLAEYEIPTEGGVWLESPDAQRFLRWYKTMQARLRAENWITRADLWRVVPNWFYKGHVQPGAVIFAALTSVSPGLKTLSRALGESVKFEGLGAANPAPATASQHASAASEMEQTARSVRHLLETETVRSIGILVPDLQSHAPELLRTLNKILYPSSDPGDHIHVQAGSLLHHPVISNALLLLELAQPRVHFASAGAILRSPFIDGCREERHLRALADQKLRRTRELDFSESEIERAVWDCPILYQILRRISKLKGKLRPPMPLPQWSTAFSDLLEAARWPALENLTESETSVVERWNAALTELASLGLVSPAINLDKALDRLRSILSRPSTLGDWSSPVQILDANSAEGIEFDQTYIVNATEEAWPPPVNLSPLIPYELQRIQQVPSSNRESAAEERLRKTRSLFTSAPSVHVSYTGNAAGLLKPYIQPMLFSKYWDGLSPEQSYAPVELETQEDIQAPPLSGTQELRGGAGIVKSQSLCAFRAFAEYRLNAKGDDEATFGFDALERGKSIHKALELIWKELGSQRKLKALSSEELSELVHRNIAAALQGDHSDGPIHVLTSLAERDRLVGLLLRWLELEKVRPSPFVVELLEDSRVVEVAGLKLTLRMDRVDRLDNGNLLLVDYKSGKQSAKNLEGHRPKEPQLLVYAAGIDEPIEGLYFGELQNRKPRPVGHGARKHFGAGARTEEHADFADFVASSKDTVIRLVEEFKSGAASVNPLPGACEYCSMKPICRVGGAGPSEEVEE